MKKKDVYRISVVLSFIGLATMFAVETVISPESYNIGDIDESMTGEHVELEGNVENFNTAQGHLFLELNDNGDQISVVEFDSETWIDSDDLVTVQGHVDIYEGDLQVIAEEIR